MANARKRGGSAGGGDLTLEVLRGMREDLRSGFEAVRREIGLTNERLDRTNERLDRLEKRNTETEVRLATELVGVANAVGQVRELLQTRLDVRDQVHDHEKRIQAIETKLGQ